MTLFELILAVVVVVFATVASIFGGLTAPLAGLLGIALGYAGKAAVNASPLPTTQAEKALDAPPFRGAPE